MSRGNMFLIYKLIDEHDNIKYIGMTRKDQLRKRITEHKRKKPPHKFIVITEKETILEASVIEQELISEYNTFSYKGWNKSPGGEYEHSSGLNRKGIGGAPKGRIPWNKGKSAKEDSRIQQNVNAVAKARKENGTYISHGKLMKELWKEPEFLKKFRKGRKLGKIERERKKSLSI